MCQTDELMRNGRCIELRLNDREQDAYLALAFFRLRHRLDKKVTGLPPPN